MLFLVLIVAAVFLVRRRNQNRQKSRLRGASPFSYEGKNDNNNSSNSSNNNRTSPTRTGYHQSWQSQPSSSALIANTAFPRNNSGDHGYEYSDSSTPYGGGSEIYNGYEPMHDYEDPTHADNVYSSGSSYYSSPNALMFNVPQASGGSTTLRSTSSAFSFNVPWDGSVYDIGGQAGAGASGWDPRNYDIEDNSSRAGTWDSRNYDHVNDGMQRDYSA